MSTETATPTPPVDNLDETVTAVVPTAEAAVEPPEVEAASIADRPLRVVVVSGMSGAGRSTAATRSTRCCRTVC